MACVSLLWAYRLSITSYSPLRNVATVTLQQQHPTLGFKCRWTHPPQPALVYVECTKALHTPASHLPQLLGLELLSIRLGWRTPHTNPAWKSGNIHFGIRNRWLLFALGLHSKPRLEYFQLYIVYATIKVRIHRWLKEKHFQKEIEKIMQGCLETKEF